MVIHSLYFFGGAGRQGSFATDPEFLGTGQAAPMKRLAGYFESPPLKR
jgi:hypothetical protein